MQCNLSGKPYWMIANDAPDPRDLFWSNIGVDRKILENRKIIVQFLLLLGLLGWGTIVGVITSLTNSTIEAFEDLGDTINFGLIRGEIIGYSIPACEGTGVHDYLMLLTIFHRYFFARLHTCVGSVSRIVVVAQSLFYLR